MRHILKVVLVFVTLVSLTVGSAAIGQGIFTGSITFVHEDTGSGDPAEQVYNLMRLAPNYPAQQVALTRFTAGNSIVRKPVWSKDYRQLAFSGNINSPFSLESYSIFAMNADGSNLRQVSGSGTLARISGPLGTVVGRVIDPRGGSRSLSSVVVSAQGMTQTTTCREDGSFVFENVPVGVSWVKAEGLIRYPEDTTTEGPGLSMGFTNVQVKAGQVTNAGTVVINPHSSASLEPSWSSDGKQMVVTHENTLRALRTDGQGKAPRWQTDVSYALAVWGTNGTFVRNLILPNLPTFQLMGPDWSPTQNMIACGAIGNATGQGFLAALSPDGTMSRSLHQVSKEVTTPQQFITQCRWSPDGKRVAFVQISLPPDASLATAQLYVIQADTTGLRLLASTNPGQFMETPSWSPDGQFLAYDVADSPDGETVLRSDIYAVNVNGGGVTRLTDDGRSYHPAWGR